MQLVAIDMRKQNTFLKNVETALSQGFIVVPWKKSNTCNRYLNSWYDAMNTLDHPTVIVYLKDDGSGQIRYDFITTDVRKRKPDHRMKIHPLTELLFPMFERHPQAKRLKTKIDKECFFHVGDLFGEIVFTERIQCDIMSIVFKHIEVAIGREINHYGNDRGNLTLAEILGWRRLRGAER